jgi:hypothetical protein
MNGTLVEVSASGGLVVCEEGTMQLGDACALIVFNGNRPAFEVEGTVVNVHYPLAGIRFSADEQLVAETLRRIVDLNFATQQISRREVAALLC